MRVLGFQLSLMTISVGIAYLANPNLRMTWNGPLENKDLVAGIGTGLIVVGCGWLGKLLGNEKPKDKITTSI